MRIRVIESGMRIGAIGMEHVHLGSGFRRLFRRFHDATLL